MNKENLYTPDCIRTVSGQYINVFDPNPDTIIIEDIAHALSMQCRFGGHLPGFYSVAEHSYGCALRVPDEYKLAALMHDASEAYLLDIPRPIKNRLSNYKDIEERLMQMIAYKFGFAWPMPKEVKEMDEYMLKFEWGAYMLGGLMGWAQPKARHYFFKEFKRLTSC